MKMGVLRDRDYRLYWAGESVSIIGSAMAVFAMPLTAVVVLHAGAFEVGMLQAAAWLPSLLVGLFAGAWVDRARKRPVMIAADLVSFVLFASVPVAAWAGVLTIGQVVAVAFGGGIARVFFSAADPPFLRSVVKQDDRMDAYAKVEVSFWAGELGAPGLAGLLAQLAGAVAGVLANALSFLVSAFCLLRIRAAEPEAAPDSAPQEKSSLRRDIAEGVRFVVRDPYIRLIALSAGVGNFGECVMNAAVVVFLVRTIGTGTGVAGLLVAAAGAGGLIGSLVATSVGRRLGNARGILVSAAVTAPFVLLIPLTSGGPGLLLFAVGMLCYGIGVAISNVLAQTFSLNYVPEHLLGRYGSTIGIVIQGTQPLGAVVGAIIGGAAGPRAALWAGAVAIVLGAVILFLGPIRKHRDMPTAAEEPGLLALDDVQ
jgi:MFS family permease